jgi:hypothetical protein
MNMINEKYYHTTDLGLTAALTIFYKIHKMDKSDPQKVVFIFIKDKDFDLYVERFYRGELKEDLQQYFQHLKMLKNRIYNG